jgi:hypothetical protein
MFLCRFQGPGFKEATMIETALSINGQDCTTGPGNTPEEYEAIAATFLRLAQAVREQNHGTIQCLSRDGQLLVSAIVHNRALARNGKELEFPIIEQLRSSKPCDRDAAFCNMSRSIIDRFRQLNVESQ